MSSFKGRRILMMAGGTGGHIFPALTIADALQQEGAVVHWLGSVNGLEVKILQTTDIPLSTIAVSGLRGKLRLSWLWAPFVLLKAGVQVWKVFKQFKPQLCIGMGGFVSGPGGVVSWLLGVPLVIHEQNAVAGFTNRCLAYLAKRVLCGFPNAFPGPPSYTTVVGNPVRTGILATRAQREGRPLTAFSESNPLKILVLGGSRGAAALNECVPRALALLKVTQKRYALWHQTGEHLRAETAALYQKLALNARVEAFISEMEVAYAWADLVVCRAGALTLAEIASVGIPAILVPYPFAVDDHQTKNAQCLVEQGAALLVPQPKLTDSYLSEIFEKFQQNPKELQAMAQATQGVAALPSTQAILAQCLEVIHD